MAGRSDADVRVAGLPDAGAIGQLLHDFNTEFSEPTPTPNALAERIRELIAGRELRALVAGEGPDGLAVLRFRPSMWTSRLECYLAELYGFTNRERENGPVMYDYEREL